MLLCLMLWFLVFRAILSDTNTCWDNEQRCVIKVHIQRGSLQNEPVLPYKINCLKTSERFKITSEPEWLHKDSMDSLHRFEHVNSVTLDGCQTPFNAVTYGYEFLPNCGENLQASVERFHGDSISQFHCHTAMKLEVLKFRNNEIATICANSFSNLNALREVFLSRNSIRHVNRLAFENLFLIRLIHIEQEEFLNIREGNFFERTTAADLRLIALKELPVDLMQHLPKSIRFILIADIDLKEKEVVLVNPIALLNISVINCSVETFVLDDPHNTVAYLNLSRNAIIGFQQRVNSIQCSLQILDLSENKLTYLREEWLHNLQCLQTLALQGNQLKKLSLQNLLLATRSANHIDLRQNSLEDLEVTDDLLQIDCDRIKISVDRNPWNCMWLVKFIDSHPDKFKIFQYKKLISKMNVNGLECRVNQGPFEGSFPINGTTTKKQEPSIPHFVNRSMYMLIYGNSRDSKRNQRAEALIIVFMLPLGIAILFVLLYMWIYCQKIFHWSYYRSIPMLGNSRSAISDHFEVGHQVPPTEDSLQTLDVHMNDECEIQMKAESSECNCSHVRAENNRTFGAASI